MLSPPNLFSVIAAGVILLSYFCTYRQMLDSVQRIETKVII